nr:DUF47 family protein [Maliibacterium massiliense]
MAMTRKKDTNYFTLLYEMSVCAHRAAMQLDDLVHNFTDVSQKAEDIHTIEHDCDKLLHRMIQEVNAAFITPLDREDILDIGNGIDSITDAVEDVANAFDMLVVQKIDAAAADMTHMIVTSCEALCVAVKEFERFKNAKRLSECIIQVNRCEEEGDRLYRASVRNLFANPRADMLHTLKWKEVYGYMEDVLDACEDVANLLERVAIKNR